MKTTVASNFVLTPRSDDKKWLASLEIPLTHPYHRILCLEFQKHFSLSFIQDLFGMTSVCSYAKAFSNHVLFVGSRSGDAWARPEIVSKLTMFSGDRIRPHSPFCVKPAGLAACKSLGTVFEVLKRFLLIPSFLETLLLRRPLVTFSLQRNERLT